MLAEAAARIAGFEPVRSGEGRIRVEPTERYQQADPALGFRQPPGEWHFTLADGHSWTAFQDSDGLRITRPRDESPAPEWLPEIWIFGCSFVHGWGLDDEETLPWKLQKKLPGYRVRNFGAGGYSTLQSLLQLREALAERGPPAIAVLAYAGFHDERNAWHLRWRWANFPHTRFGYTAQPYARIGEGGGLDYHFDRTAFAGSALLTRSALLNLLVQAFRSVETRIHQSHEVSRRLVHEFERTVTERGATFVLAGISREAATRRMLAWARGEKLHAVPIWVDLRDPELVIPEDGHPNPRAARRYARRLLRYLTDADLVTIGQR